jgi:hypothetical protein
MLTALWLARYAYLLAVHTYPSDVFDTQQAMLAAEKLQGAEYLFGTR